MQFFVRTLMILANWALLSLIRLLYQLALCNTKIINIEYGIAIIYLLEILNLDHFTLNFEF